MMAASIFVSILVLTKLNTNKLYIKINKPYDEVLGAAQFTERTSISCQKLSKVVKSCQKLSKVVKSCKKL